MIHDLNRSAAGATTAQAQVCVIGSGPAGLALARALCANGVSVLIVEAGPGIAAVADKPQDVSFRRREYRGATLGRAFGFGGTSALWGGQLLPLRPEEMDARPGAAGLAWPIDHGEIARYYPVVERWTGVGEGSFDISARALPGHPLAALRWQAFSPRASKWIAFGRRNLARAWWPAIAKTGKAQLWLNATACEWQGGDVHGQRGIRRLIARSPEGRRLEIDAAQFVICAGALESARLALEMMEATGGGEPASRALAGRFLQDHLSVRIAQVKIRRRARFNELFAPFFSGAIMRSPRLDLSPRATVNAGLPPAYGHFVAVASERSGFAALRDTLRSLQARQPGRALRHGLKALRALPDVLDLMYWRFLRRRLAFPADAAVFLQLDFEQPQCFENRLELGEAQPSQGRRALVIDWAPECDAGAVIEHAIRELRVFWARNGLNEIADLQFLNRGPSVIQLNDNLYDIYHPAGTTRMAVTSEEGVVDPHLKVFGVANCHIASTAVFPSMGAGNPTFTLLALCLRLAERLTPLVIPVSHKPGLIANSPLFAGAVSEG